MIYSTMTFYFLPNLSQRLCFEDVLKWQLLVFAKHIILYIVEKQKKAYLMCLQYYDFLIFCQTLTVIYLLFTLFEDDYPS